MWMLAVVRMMNRDARERFRIEIEKERGLAAFALRGRVPAGTTPRHRLLPTEKEQTTALLLCGGLVRTE
jgi:hypothetical protein